MQLIVGPVVEGPGVELTGSPSLELTINTFGLAVLMEFEPLEQLALASPLILALSPLFEQMLCPVAAVAKAGAPELVLAPTLQAVDPEADVDFSLVTDEDLGPAEVEKV